MADKAIERWNKAELIQFIKTAIGEIVEILPAYETAMALKKALGKDGEFEAKIQEIQSAHAAIYTGDDENQPIKKEMDGLMQELQENVTKITKAKKELLGHVVSDPGTGQDVKRPGYISTMRKKLGDGEKNYVKLLDQTEQLRKEIQNELRSGMTTIGLSKAFNEKAAEYKTIRGYLEVGMIVLFLLGIGASIFLYKSVQEWGVQALLFSFLPHISAVGLFVWLMIFLGNRRAENKKLEEIYKHKGAMAKSYVGYEKSIESLGRTGVALLPKLMENLLEAIKKDPSEFLSVKGEKHPATDLLQLTKEGK
ncbi:MAG: hypothetical protein OD918_06100 [Gammaproteobacteria bacterium]